MTSDENYYKVLDFLDTAVKNKQLDSEIVKSFKGAIRDNKYVSTYIRSLQKMMKNYNDVDDLIRAIDLDYNSKSFQTKLDYELENILDLGYGSKTWTQDPIKIINTIIFSAMQREGKLCDFRDSVNPQTKIGRCEAEEHCELLIEGNQLTSEQKQKFDFINKNEGWKKACDSLEDELNPPNQELSLLLYSDEDTNKFDDNLTCYSCKACSEYSSENSDCEVSCDMEVIS